MTAPVWVKQVKTQAGTFAIAAGRRGLLSLEFPGHCVRRPEAAGRMPLPVRRNLRKAERRVRAYAAGKRPVFSAVRIDDSLCRPFDRAVLRTLVGVRPGMTVTYGELARRAGYPGAARAVGSVMRRNRLPFFLPCHRVVRSDGTLGEYSGGRGWKRRLLVLEGCPAL